MKRITLILDDDNAKFAMSLLNLIDDITLLTFQDVDRESIPGVTPTREVPQRRVQHRALPSPPAKKRKVANSKGIAATIQEAFKEGDIVTSRQAINLAESAGFAPNSAYYGLNVLMKGGYLEKTDEGYRVLK